jgi:hypothetical protein
MVASLRGMPPLSSSNPPWKALILTVAQQPRGTIVDYGAATCEKSFDDDDVLSAAATTARARTVIARVGAADGRRTTGWSGEIR